jgi:cell division protein FtsZ
LQPSNACLAPLLAPGVVAIGGAGCRIVGRLDPESTAPAKRIAIDTDAASLLALSGWEAVPIGRKTHPQPFCGPPPRWVRQAVLDDEPAIRAALAGSRVALLVAGMGGMCATVAAPVVAQIARRSGLVVVAIAATPFAFERGRARRAREGMVELENSADFTVAFPNDRAFEHVSYDDSALRAYEVTNDVLREMIAATLRAMADADTPRDAVDRARSRLAGVTRAIRA